MVADLRQTMRRRRSIAAQNAAVTNTVWVKEQIKGSRVDLNRLRGTHVTYTPTYRHTQIP